MLDQHVLRRSQPAPTAPAPDIETDTKDQKAKKMTITSPSTVCLPKRHDKGVSTDGIATESSSTQPDTTVPIAIPRRINRASEPLAAPNARAGPSVKRRVDRPAMKARQSLPAIPTKRPRSRRDTTSSDLTVDSDESNYSRHAVSPLEIRPTLRSDLRKVVDKERDAFLGIEPDRPRKKSRLEKDWGIIEELTEVQNEDAMVYEILLDSLRIWIEDNEQKEAGDKQAFDKQVFLADLQERVSDVPRPGTDMIER